MRTLAAVKGDFSRMPLEYSGMAGKIADNDIIELNQRMA